MAQRIREKREPKPRLHVLPRGDAMVMDYAALKHAHVRRHIGMRHDPDLGPVLIDPQSGKPDAAGKRSGGWRIVQDEPVQVPGSADPGFDPEFYGAYVKHVRDGDLWAATMETAVACGVAFEPHFNDEHPGHTAGEHCQVHLRAQRELEERQVAEARAHEASLRPQVTVDVEHAVPAGGFEFDPSESVSVTAPVLK